MTTSMHPVVEKFVLHWGEMAARWGVNRTVSQIHALLYLSERPLAADEIAEALGVARSNVSTSLRELQGWKVVRVAHVLGDRRDHFESIQDITELFRVIVDERKRRELDPTLAMLRHIGANDPTTPPHVRQKLKSTLAFLEILDHWYKDMKGMPHPLMLALLRMGGRIQRFLKSEPG